MAINRRERQSTDSSMDGLTIRTLVDASTDSKMLTVLDIDIRPGAEIQYRTNTDHEESYLVADGDVQFKLDGETFPLTGGDCVVVPKGQAAGLMNIGSKNARIITVCPHPSPNRVPTPEPDFTSAQPGENVMIRAQTEPFEFAPGVWRIDMVGDFRGAQSTYFSRLQFEPGATTPNHYHPAHEEAMFCINGSLSAVYDENDDIPLPAGDVFLCEPTIRHTVNNRSDQPGTLLAIHPVLNPPPRVVCD